MVALPGVSSWRSPPIVGYSAMGIDGTAARQLTSSEWIPRHKGWATDIVGTNTLTAGSSYFSDPQWTNHPSRFYRLRSP